MTHCGGHSSQRHVLRSQHGYQLHKKQWPGHAFSPHLCFLPAQVATEPDLAPLLSELVDSSDGQEIYLRRPERFGLVIEKPVSFSQVSTC